MKRIGLTGSIAMGKSEVAKILRAEGVPVFDADAEVHAIYDSLRGGAILQPLAPEAIEDGKVSRAKLSKLVLADKTLLEKLETVMHAEVARARDEFFHSTKEKGHALAVADIPLLFEKGGEKHFDVTIVVSAPEEMQRTRALSRPGMTPEKLEMILARQMPDHEKRRRADYIIMSDGTLGDLRERTLAVIAKIRHS